MTRRSGRPGASLPSQPARYRLPAELRRGWASYLAILMIVGLLGGTAMASVAAARRTQSAFPRILAASNPSDVTVDTGSQSPGLVGRLSHLPQVRSAESYVALDALRALPSGYADPDTPFNQQVELVGSLNGLYFDQDRVIITAGRRANPRRPGEVVVSELTAHRFGLHLGQSLAANFYSGQQAADPGFNPMTRPPLRRVRLTITGIGVFTDEVVQDDIDRSYRVLATPALTRTELRCCGSFYWTGLRLARGARDVEAVQRENTRGLPKYSPAFFRVTSVVVDQAERAVRPESVAAAGFGLIAAAGAFVLATQAIRRKILDGRGARDTLRAMGASPSGLVLDAVLGPVCAVAAGTVLALAVAVAASPLAPLGQLHRLEPAPGVSFDWAVLGAGAAASLLILSVAAVTLAWVDVGSRSRERGLADRRAAARTAALSLPVTARAGVSFAFQPERAGSPRPVVPGVLGTAVALVILLGSLAFGASLSNLASHPALYGWAWNTEILSGSGYGHIPLSRARSVLGRDPDISAWSGGYFLPVEINGQAVPVLAATDTRLSPPILAGHALAGPDQIVLGPETLAAVGGHVGGRVRVFNSATTRTMQVVGTATMPAIGVGHANHLSLGSGAILPASSLPQALLNRDAAPLPRGPNTILVRFRPAVDHAAAARRLTRITSRLTPDGVQVLPVQRPAEIVNYRTMGTTPLILAGLLAAGAVMALALTLTASVRRRSRELALLKTLGFVRRQVVAAVIWQAVVIAAIGTAIGVPLGVAAGRFLWVSFAAELYVVPQPVISTIMIAGTVASALAAASLAAVGPAWRAARTPVATVLRAE